MANVNETIGAAELIDEHMAKKLQNLIELDVDAVHAYTQSIDALDEAHDEIRQQLIAFRADHERHIDELSSALRQAGHEAKVRRDLKGFLIEGMTALRSRMGTESALKAMRQNEELTNRKYEDALQLALPPGVAALVRRNREDERRHLEYIRTALDNRIWESGARPSMV